MLEYLAFHQVAVFSYFVVKDLRMRVAPVSTAEVESAGVYLAYIGPKPHALLVAESCDSKTP